MKRTELNNIFTAKVNEYLAKGYTFNTDTMSGSQGEIAKVDLTNGEEIIRIILSKEYDGWKSNTDYYLSDYFQILVGRATEVTGASYDRTIWNNKLEVLEQEKYYMAGYRQTEYLISEEEAIENAKKWTARRTASKWAKEEKEITDPGFIKALLPYIHQEPGCKSIKARHIIKVYREHGIYKVHYQKKKDQFTKTVRINPQTIRNNH